MALPTLTSNSPVAGSIAWTAFGIQFDGVSYPIAAGNTAFKYVWWEFATKTIKGANVAPTFKDSDLLLFLNKNGVGALVPMTDVTDGSLIVPQSILTDAIAANQITTELIAAGAVTAKEISAGSITTDKLGVGSVGDNLVTNSSFEEFDENGMAIGWKTTKTTSGSMDVASGVASSGANSFRFTATATSSDLRMEQTPDRWIPVSSASNRKWYVSARVGASPATTKGLYLRVNWHDGSKNYISSSDMVANSAITTTFTVYEGQATPPATARYMSINVLLVAPSVATIVFLDEVTAREVVIAAQIGDGAITAAKILAGEVNATHIQSGSITTDKLLVSDRSNYWENSTFEDDTVGQLPRGIEANSFCRVLGEGANGSLKSMEVDARAANNNVYGNVIYDVKPGDKFYFEYDYKFLNTVGTATISLGFRRYSAAKVYQSDSAGPTISGRPTAWTNSGPQIYTVPAGTYFVKPWFCFRNNGETTNRLHVDNVVMRRMNGGELIIDGALDATKISGATIVGGEVKTTETTNAVGARLGPTVVTDNILGAPAGNFPGIGFTKNNGAANPAGMYTKTGDDVNIVQSGIYQGMPNSYVRLADNTLQLGGRDGVSIDSGPPGSGPVTINGNVMETMHAEFTNGGFGVSGGNVSWDIGPLTVDLTNSTTTPATWVTSVGQVSGAVKVLKAGYYSVDCWHNPNAFPGYSRVLATCNGIGFAQTEASAYWENYLAVPAVYLKANDVVRFVVNSANAYNGTSRVRIRKLPV